MFQHHESMMLIPPGAEAAVSVDIEMVPLVQQLWARGLKTLACCQDNGEAVAAERGNAEGRELSGQRAFIDYYNGWAWLKMPVLDTLTLLSSIAAHEVFGDRVRIRWQRASWRIQVPVIYGSGRFGPAPYSQIYFPKEQITELTAALTTLG
jgi:hypothetical protein